MPESPDLTSAGVPAEATVTDEIARSLGSLWQRMAGTRPKSTSIEIANNRVRCVMEEGVPGAEESEDGEVDSPEVALGSARFQRDASAVVHRATGRRVAAFIAKRDEGTRTSRQTFILDSPRQRN
jgi:hypothetical protein